MNKLKEKYDFKIESVRLKKYYYHLSCRQGYKSGSSASFKFSWLFYFEFGKQGIDIWNIRL